MMNHGTRHEGAVVVNQWIMEWMQAIELRHPPQVTTGTSVRQSRSKWIWWLAEIRLIPSDLRNFSAWLWAAPCRPSTLPSQSNDAGSLFFRLESKWETLFSCNCVTMYNFKIVSVVWVRGHAEVHRLIAPLYWSTTRILLTAVCSTRVQVSYEQLSSKDNAPVV